MHKNSSFQNEFLNLRRRQGTISMKKLGAKNVPNILTNILFLGLNYGVANFGDLYLEL